MLPKLSLFLIALVPILFFIFPTTAEEMNITFADLNLIEGAHVLVYNASDSGSFVGEYNSTATVKLDNAKSYIFVFKPTSQSWFTSPEGVVEMLKNYLPITVNYMIAAVIILGIAWAIAKLWK